MGGRGEYYKNKYGGGRGRGRGGGRGGRGRAGRDSNQGAPRSSPPSGGGSYADLKQLLLYQLDNQQYPRYHDLETPLTEGSGWHNTEAGFTLLVGRTQSDPFAPPTRCRVIVSAARAQLPPQAYNNSIRAMATSDYLARQLYQECRRMGADASLNNNSSSNGGGGRGGGWSGPKGGDIQVMEPSQHVLEQTAVTIDATSGNVVAQVTINLPARGRTILGQAAADILDRVLTSLVGKALCYPALNSAQLKHHVDSVEDQYWVQQQLASRGLVAFVRNGAILPRASGVADTPMVPISSNDNNIITFQSPQRLEVTFDLPTLGIQVTGMGIPRGITLICGGGFHGKSTLLQAIQLGVYPKIPGDGREFCVTSHNAMKIRAEDGRAVTAVNISPFINNLPFGKDTTNFSTPDASGSTSQASNIVESIEAGADTLLIDEDTCASNAMIRDDKMVQLVASEKEPITPFVRLVRPLYDEIGLSSIMIGGSGDFFAVADNVLCMDSYQCLDATDRAKNIAAADTPSSQQHHVHTPGNFQQIRVGGRRYPVANAFNPGGKVKVLSKSSVSYGDVDFDLSGLEQLATKSQSNAISAALQMIPSVATNGNVSLEHLLNQVEQLVDGEGLNALAPGQLDGGLARTRRLELASAINRIRRPGAIVQR